MTKTPKTTLLGIKHHRICHISSEVWLINLTVGIVSSSAQNVFNNQSQNFKPETWKKEAILWAFIHTCMYLLQPFWKYCKWHICVTWLCFNASLLFKNTSLIKADDATLPKKQYTCRWENRLLQSLDPWSLIHLWALIHNFTTEFHAIKGTFPWQQATFKVSWNNKLYRSPR